MASPGRNIPGHNQHCPRRPAEDTFAHRALSKTSPAAPHVGAKDYEVGFPRIGMQHDRSSGIAVLLDGSDRNTVAFGAFPQPGEKLEPLALMR